MKVVKNEYHLLFQWHCLNYFFSILCILVRLILQVVGFLCDGNACLKKHIPTWSAWIFHCNTNCSYCCNTIILFGNSFNQWHCCYLCLLLLSLFMCLYKHTHVHLKVTASTKRVNRVPRGCICRSKQRSAAIWVSTCVDGELTTILWPWRVPIAKAFPCVFVETVSLQHGCWHPCVQVISWALPSSAGGCVWEYLHPLHAQKLPTSAGGRVSAIPGC